MTPPPPPPTLQSLRLRENQLFFFITVLVGVLAGVAIPPEQVERAERGAERQNRR